MAYRYGLAWNPVVSGQLLSAADDHIVCLWDINQNPVDGAIEAMRKFSGHTKIAEVCGMLGHLTRK